jgi:hypothetical protein
MPSNKAFRSKNNKERVHSSLTNFYDFTPLSNIPSKIVVIFTLILTEETKLKAEFLLENVCF